MLNTKNNSIEYKLEKLLQLATVVFSKEDLHISCTVGMYVDSSIECISFQLWIDKVDEDTLDKSTFLKKTFTESESFEECYTLLYSKLEKLSNKS